MLFGSPPKNLIVVCISEDKRVIFSFFLCDSRIIILFYKFFAVIKPLFQINL